MNQLERVARLLGWVTSDGERPFIWRRRGQGGAFVQYVPAYDTDANATAELRRYVREKGMRQEFVGALVEAVGFSDPDYGSYKMWFAVLDATPQQQFDTFCKVFAKELEAIQ